MSKTSKRAPSKRASPPNVAIHRNPSSSWVMALTEFCGRPSSVVQEVWATTGENSTWVVTWWPTITQDKVEKSSRPTMSSA